VEKILRNRNGKSSKEWQSSHHMISKQQTAIKEYTMFASTFILIYSKFTNLFYYCGATRLHFAGNKPTVSSSRLRKLWAWYGYMQIPICWIFANTYIAVLDIKNPNFPISRKLQVGSYLCFIYFGASCYYHFPWLTLCGQLLQDFVSVNTELQGMVFSL